MAINKSMTPGKTMFPEDFENIVFAMHNKIKRIFVVDDESDTTLALTNVLEDNGFVVHTFNDSPGIGKF